MVSQLERYNGEGTVAHRQRLVWKLSNRTLRHLRPTDKLRCVCAASLLDDNDKFSSLVGSLQAGDSKCLFFRPTLPTIKERSNPHVACKAGSCRAGSCGAAACRAANVHRVRSNSESSEVSMSSLYSEEDSEDSNEEMMEEEEDDDSSEGDSDR